jgi:hypothetical protein
MEAASKIGKLATNMQVPAHDIHITPDIAELSLISTAKFAEAGYMTIFTSNQVNIYDQHNTLITVLQAAIICGWCEPNGLYRIPLIPIICNNNTGTVLVKQPPSKFLPGRPPPEEAVFNVYKLRTQPELVQYLHAAAGFPTKLTWYNAVRNKQFALWPGLTPKAMAKHFPKSKETIIGQSQKAKSGQPSTKRKPSWDDNLISKHKAEEERTCPSIKEHEIFIHVYNMKEDEAPQNIYQPDWLFPQEVKPQQPICDGVG